MVEKNAAPVKSAEDKIQVRGSGFISENTGNIKDFYKISSCIGRGKRPVPLTPRSGPEKYPLTFFRSVWRGKEVFAQGDQGPKSRQNNKQKVPGRGREGQIAV